MRERRSIVSVNYRSFFSRERFPNRLFIVRHLTKVVVGKFAGQELKLDGEDYSIVKIADILAIVK